MRQLKINKSITNRESASLEQYLKDISKMPLITADEEVELTRRIKTGDPIALEKLTKANLRFVVSVAKQYQNNGLPLIDLINEGNLGLIKAAGRFDETRGFKFISYAVWRIRQGILQALAEYGRIVRLPLNKVGNISKLNQAFSALEQKYGRDPTPEELAEALDIRIDEVLDTVKIKGGRHSSLDAPIGGDGEGDFTLGDTNLIPGDQDVQDELFTAMSKAGFAEAMRIIVSHKFSKNPRAKEVLFRYFGIGQEHPETLEDIGLAMNLSRERVRQIKDKSLGILKNLFQNHGSPEDIVEALRHGGSVQTTTKKKRITITTQKEVITALDTRHRERPQSKPVITEHHVTVQEEQETGTASPVADVVSNTKEEISVAPTKEEVLIDIPEEQMTNEQLLQKYAGELAEIEKALQIMSKKDGCQPIDYLYIVQCRFVVDSYLIFLYLWRKYDDIHSVNTIDRNYISMFVSHNGKMSEIRKIYGQEETHGVYDAMRKAFAVIDQGLKKEVIHDQ